MRIISDFGDYYDSSMAYDQDRDTLYHRKTKYLDKYKDMPKWPIFYPGYIGPIGIKFYIVGLCYKLYPFVSIGECGTGKYLYYHSLEKVESFFLDYLSNKEFDIWMGEHKSRDWKYSYLHAMRHSLWQKFFNLDTSHSDLFNKHDVPIFNAYTYGRHVDWNLVLNPCLRVFEFYKCLSGFEVYQELTMYFGNIASPEKPIPHIDDITLAEAKGFDKYSFRKDKSK